MNVRKYLTTHKKFRDRMIPQSIALHKRRFCSSAFNFLATNNLVQAVEAGSQSWGVYGVGNLSSDSQWKKLSENIINRIDVEKESIENINTALRILSDRNVSIGSFWSELFEKKLDQRIKVEKLKMTDLISLISNCNAVDFRSEVVIDKLISGLLENETVWVIAPDELSRVAQVIADSFTQNRQLFTEISNRVTMEVSEFETDQLVSVVESFSKINFTNSEMLRVVLKRVVDEWPQTSLPAKMRLADATSKLRYRSDTFFRELASEILVDSAKCQINLIASFLVSMKRLKMESGSTAWWDRERDVNALIGLIRDGFLPEAIAGMDGKGIANCIQVLKVSNDKRSCNAIFGRLKHLLAQDPLSRSHRYLAVITETLAKGVQQSPGTNGDDLRWIAEWLCGNVYILPVHDIATINRAIAKMGFRDHNYHKIWIPYYLERINEITKDDITLISDNYNSIGMNDTVMGGRHFFYRLGKRFQELTADTTGDEEVAVARKFRTMQRLG